MAMNETFTTTSSWSYNATGSLSVIGSYTNNSSISKKIKTVTCSIGTAKGTFTSGDTVVGSGGEFTTYISISGTSSSSKTVDNVVGEAGPEGGTYPDKSQCSDYEFTFTSGVSVGPGETVNISIKCPSGGLCLAYNNDGSRLTTVYEGKPATPSAPSSDNLSVVSSKLYEPVIYLRDLVSWLGGSATGCQYQAVYYTGLDNGWVLYSQNSYVNLGNLYSKIQFRLYNQVVNDNYETPSSEYSYSEIKTTEIKLNSPTCSYTTSDTGGYTIGESVTVTSSPPSDNPSGINHIIEYSVDGGESQSGTYTDNPASHYLTSSSTRFRSKVSKSGYKDSDYSSWTEPVSVYYEPRSMTSNGFTFSFYSNGSAITSETVSQPGASLSVSWSSFLTSKNLGRFNYFRFSLIDSSTNEVLSFKEGSNDPSSESSVSIEVDPDWSGKSCYLKLECICYYETSYHGPQSSGVFESSTFLVGGSPYVRVVYPYSTEFYSCNRRVRLIFDVISPSNLNGGNITNVTVKVRTSSREMSYNYNNSSSRQNFYSTLSVKPDEIVSGSRIDFTLPEITDDLNGSVFQIKCSNELMDSDWTSQIKLNYVDTGKSFSDTSGYISSGRTLLKSDMMHIHDWTRDVLRGYYNFNSSAWRVADSLIPDRDKEGYYLVQERPCKETISLLSSVYNIVKNYSLPPDSLVIDLNKIDINSSGEKVEASKPPFSLLVEGKFSPIGNYFNYILYILKNML